MYPATCFFSCNKPQLSTSLSFFLSSSSSSSSDRDNGKLCNESRSRRKKGSQTDGRGCMTKSKMQDKKERKNEERKKPQKFKWPGSTSGGLCWPTRHSIRKV